MEGGGGGCRSGNYPPNDGSRVFMCSNCWVPPGAVREINGGYQLDLVFMLLLQYSPNANTTGICAHKKRQIRISGAVKTGASDRAFFSLSNAS